MRADKYDPRYINRYSPRNLYADFWDWLFRHPIWVINIVLGYAAYIATTEEVN